MTNDEPRRFPVRLLLFAGLVLVVIAVGLVVRHEVQKADEEAAHNPKHAAVREIEQLGGEIQTNGAGLMVWLCLNGIARVHKRQTCQDAPKTCQRAGRKATTTMRRTSGMNDLKLVSPFPKERRW